MNKLYNIKCKRVYKTPNQIIDDFLHNPSMIDNYTYDEMIMLQEYYIKSRLINIRSNSTKFNMSLH